jgi:hypothetical protein
MPRSTLKRRGVSLLEVLVGAVLASLALTISARMYLAVSRLSGRTQALVFLQESALIVMGRLGADLRSTNAAGIVFAQSGGSSAMTVQPLADMLTDPVITYKPELLRYSWDNTQKVLVRRRYVQADLVFPLRIDAPLARAFDIFSLPATGEQRVMAREVEEFSVVSALPGRNLENPLTVRIRLERAVAGHSPARFSLEQKISLRSSSL